jgi:uncharacterized protein (TIGR02147 family)
MSGSYRAMLFNHIDYRKYLKAAYVERSSKNDRYSLRAFARHLGLSPAAVTRIFKGEKSLSVKRAVTIAQKLHLDRVETEYFCLLVQLAQTEDPELQSTLYERLNALRPEAPIHDLSVDLFRTIADWYHLAILELTGVDGFEFTVSNVARYLGIGVMDAEVAIDRLKRLELIELETGTNRVVKTKNRLLVSSAIPNGAMRKHYRQMLEKAMESIETQGPDEKVIATETFAFDRESIEEAKKLTDRYLDQLVKLSEGSRNKKDLYQACIQVFRLSAKDHAQAAQATDVNGKGRGNA